MTCSPAKCADCSAACSSRQSSANAGTANGTPSAEELEGQLQAALARAKKAEEAFDKLKLENSQNVTGKVQELKPLRSQQWFNNRRSRYAWIESGGRHTYTYEAQTDTILALSYISYSSQSW